MAETFTYKISGMTCNSCVEKITQRLQAIKGVSTAKVSLNDKKATFVADHVVSLTEVQTAIADLPKYKADYDDEGEVSLSATEQKNFLQTYKPLFTVFAYILVFSLAYQISLGTFSGTLFMNHIMAGFFIGLSFFKFLDLTSFATAFANYDPLAKKWPVYGRLYPFLELTLGFLFIANLFLPFANIMTITLLGITTVGVYKKLQSKTQFQCACLGAGFNLPLSYITVAENLVMIFMALIGLFTV